MVAMVTMTLFKFYSYLAKLPHFLLAKQKLFLKEYGNNVKLQEEEILPIFSLHHPQSIEP